MTDHAQSNGTRERLLEAAQTVFARSGFRRATVREIVRRAEANLNAVNYHFRDKQGLYQAVLETAHQSIQEDEAFHPAMDSALPPSERLQAFIRALLMRALAREQAPPLMRLMAVEMAEPTEALDLVVERFIRPRFELLTEIVGQVVGTDLPQHKARLCAESVVGQCIHLVHGQQIVRRLLPELSYSAEGIEALAGHVTEFCLAALKHLPAAKGEDA